MCRVCQRGFNCQEVGHAHRRMADLRALFTAIRYAEGRGWPVGRPGIRAADILAR